MKFSILVAFFLVVLAAGAPTSTSEVKQESWSDNHGPCSSYSSDVNGVKTSVNTCTREVTWKLRHNDDCNISTYYKKTVTIVPETSTEPFNGVAQCTKTPCDATEKITVDCATAFGEKLSQIE
ncbi:Protein CBG22343 [Caenorhabditis briggsae]|uniref:Protein CBG22343 n=2 Tax=Caenorhabditis briggsae TaxID=6238 RepID=A8Y270_CAEBR|nr:Protein CBG22343 [Caenorhabditis briggsae]ULT93717.1 hypothetical protein L3Y34_003303 [Caenorhabditis briggsae]CAP38962.1 Protein CBG22343 [Caenorhabditis briggsae]